MLGTTTSYTTTGTGWCSFCSSSPFMFGTSRGRSSVDMPLPGFSEDDEKVAGLSPFGGRPGEAGQSTAESAQRAQARRVWKAYHEEQALSEAERQYRRPVRVDASQWGDLLGAQLAQLVSRERANPRVFVRGGVADRDNPRCLLPERDAGGVLNDGVVRAKPQPVAFNSEGSDFTTRSLGAGGDFTGVYQRSKEAGGLAGERARRRKEVGCLPDDDGRDSSRTMDPHKRPSASWNGRGDSLGNAEEDANVRWTVRRRTNDNNNGKIKPAAVKSFEDLSLKNNLASGALHRIQHDMEHVQEASLTSDVAKITSELAAAAAATSASVAAFACGRPSGIQGGIGSEVEVETADASDADSIGAGGTPLFLCSQSHCGGGEDRWSDDKAGNGNPRGRVGVHGWAWGIAGSVTSLGSSNDQDGDTMSVCASTSNTRCRSPVAVPRRVTRRRAASVTAAAASSAGRVDQPAVVLPTPNAMDNGGCYAEQVSEREECKTACGDELFGRVKLNETVEGAQAIGRRDGGGDERTTGETLSTKTKRRRRGNLGKGVACGIVGSSTMLPPPLDAISVSAGPISRHGRPVYMSGGAAGVRTPFQRSALVGTEPGGTPNNCDYSVVAAQGAETRLPLLITTMTSRDNGSATSDGKAYAAAAAPAVQPAGAGVSPPIRARSRTRTKAVGASVLRSTKSRRKGHVRKRTGEKVDEFGVRKIDLGSAKEQENMDTDTRTMLLIGACEWGDLETLDRLLELGASPLDSYAGTGSRCVFSQFFVFLLQVEAGLRPRLVEDPSLNDRALEKLVDRGQEQPQQRLVVPSASASLPLLRDNDRLRDDGFDDSRGFCVLHHAAAYGSLRKLKFLLDRGADPDARAGGGNETPFMVAVRGGQRNHIRVAAALLQAGCDLSAVDFELRTTLHHAADVGRKHMCRYLLLVGAGRDAEDREGKRPRDLCRRRHPRAYATLRVFAGPELLPVVVLDYLEKVEVQGLDNDTAHAHITLSRKGNLSLETGLASSSSSPSSSTAIAVERRQRHLSGPPVPAANACATVLGGDDDAASINSLWDAKSLGGLSGSVISLGSLAATSTSSSNTISGVLREGEGRRGGGGTSSIGGGIDTAGGRIHSKGDGFDSTRGGIRPTCGAIRPIRD